MKKLLFSLLCLASLAGTTSGCREQSRIPEPATDSVPLILPEINPNKSFFPFRRAQLSEQIRMDSFTLKPAYYTRPVFEFVVNPSQGYAELQTVEVYKSFRRGTTLGPRVKVADLTSFPATISLSSQEILQGLYPTSIAGTLPLLANPTVLTLNNRIAKNDAIVFTFEYVLKDGRKIILTPLSTVDGSVGAPTGTLINAPYAAVAVFK
ncbi:hypothetical protein ACVWYF_001887 [Hymenobacter sp. UYAg731]